MNDEAAVGESVPAAPRPAGAAPAGRPRSEGATTPEAKKLPASPTIEHDEFTGVTTLSLKVFDDPASIKDGKVTRSTLAFLKQRVGTNDPPALLLMVIGGEWLFLDTAVAVGNIRLPVKTDRQVRGRSIVELVHAELTPDFLAQGRSKGLRIRFYGKQGDVDVAVDAQEVERFVGALAEEGAKRGAASPSGK